METIMCLIIHYDLYNLTIRVLVYLLNSEQILNIYVSLITCLCRKYMEWNHMSIQAPDSCEFHVEM